MKKLLSVCVICILLTFAAGAANVGTIDNGYPGDTEAQAQMLCDLGLFRGTENGFELDKPMTRAEASAMLTRLLGAEQTVLTGEWTHPFTDVPSWADKYVGWLYENGLTKGTSTTTYGAEENVTCKQYCTFLARASTDYDYYSWLLRYGENEEERCDAAGFVRGDAVSLSVRLLGEKYQKNEDQSGRTVAQVLVDRGVFSAEVLGNAAEGVLNADVEVDQSAGAPVLQYEYVGVAVDSLPLTAEQNSVLYHPETQNLYLCTGTYEESQVLYRIEGKPLSLTELYRSGAGETLDLICSVGKTDYFLHNTAVGEKLLMVDASGLHDTGEQIEAGERYSKELWRQGYRLLSMTKGWYLSENGLQKIPMYGLPFATLSDGRMVTQSITEEQTKIVTWTEDGLPINTIAVKNDVLAYPTEDAHVVFAPQLTEHNDVYFWGSAGLYRMDDDGLTQITDLPTYDYTHNTADDSYVIVTHDRSRFVAYSESAVVMRTGDTLMRILPDDTVEPLLPVLPEESLLLDQVNLMADGRVQFTTLKPTEPRRMGRFTCILDDGKITVTDATDDIFYMCGDDAVAVEQARLDALGIGNGAN